MIISEKVNFGYSMKNIGLPSAREYLNQLTHSTETFVRNLRWRIWFLLNPSTSEKKEKFNFRSIRAAPKIKELQKFEDLLFDLIRNIKFRRYTNQLQKVLKEDKVKIASETKVIMPADKSSNFYKIDKDEYRDLLSREIQKKYKKASEDDEDKIKVEHSSIVTNLEIDDRVFATAKNPARITLKDHKPDFRNKPTTRLINPCKPEIGKISKQILSKYLHQLREKTGLMQFKNSDSVVSWFKGIPEKKKCSFIVLDVVEYYPSIKEKLLREALDWASSVIPMTEDVKDIIISSKKSLLYSDGTAYKKQSGSDFDVTIGSYDGAETADIVGLFLLSRVKDLGVVLAAYRDDWLGYSRLTGRQTDLIKKKIKAVFNNYDLKIDIEVNKNIVDYLDVTLDMKNESYQPFTKLNHVPIYVHKLSNHPPSVLKNIPQSVNDRLCKLSSNKELFDAASPQYQESLEQSGYSYKLEYKEIDGNAGNQPRRSRNRRRRVTYFNPPFSLNVETNVGKEFLNIVKSFPKNHVLSSVINTNTIKVSYRTLQNMGGELSRHNKLILDGENRAGPEQRCNCQARLRDQCPLPGRCTITNVVYGAKVTRLDDNSTATYTGLSSPPFKNRVKGHYQDIKNYKPSDPDKHKSGTRLSRHIGELKEQKIPYRLDWKIINETKTAYNPATNYCKLCTMEKYFIMFHPDDATLNLRSEFFSHCRHKTQHLLTKS
jgi:hypothetical protein